MAPLTLKKAGRIILTLQLRYFLNFIFYREGKALLLYGFQYYHKRHVVIRQIDPLQKKLP